MDRKALILLAAACATAAAADDPHLKALYDRLHDSPTQQRFRDAAPMPFGVVFLPWKGVTEQQIREQFRTMKRLGFHNLKQVMGSPEWPAERLMEIALEEDVIPFWYGEAGWEPVTDGLLEKLGIPRTWSNDQVRADPRMRAHQREVLRKQIPAVEAARRSANNDPMQFAHTPDPYLPAADVPHFQKWLRDHYRSPAEVADAWNEYEIDIDAHPFRTWEELDRVVAAMAGEARGLRGYGGEYGRVRDVLRFKAEGLSTRIDEAFADFHRQWPLVPTRTGGEMGLFLPFAWRATNMEQLAATQTNSGSFYPSIHLAWHFGEVRYEIARTVYMQAAFANDLFKGGWAATWESTGGPQQFTGSKGWNAEQGTTTAGFTVNAGTMTQLLLSYLAAGFKGAGIWTWNYREAGWEGGEYALLDRNLKPGARAIRAGQIAQAADRFREELWRGRKEPQVGVLTDWDSDAIWAAMSLRGRDHFRDYPMEARVGVSRALIDGNVPWEYVTVRDLEAGLGPRYPVIYLPGQIALSPRLLELLTDYAGQGGRVVLDSPGAAYDEHGKVLKTAAGTPFERLFGTELSDLQYSNNVVYELAGQRLDGFVSELTPTSAAVAARFSSGEPAATVNRVGKGAAVLLGWDASHAVFHPGKPEMETLLRQYALGGQAAPYASDAIVYRLATPSADHYFLINDGPARTVRLDTRAFRYTSASDALTGEKLSGPIALEAYSGRWLRYQK